MSFRDRSIKIIDWAGNDLFIGDYDSKDVDVVLDANRCKECHDDTKRSDFDQANGICDICDDTGYKGDFSVHWIDESDKDNCNVYEYINY